MSTAVTAALTDLVTDLVLETFRLNGRLLAEGDALVADLGLTSARWQVLGAIALSPVPISVAHIARNMGLTRQAVQRLVNEMAADGLLRFEPNPHHRRAKLVLLTSRGQAAYDAAMQRQGPWAANLMGGMSAERIEAATETLRAVRERLEHPEKGDDNA
ncbi:MarR family winged helix-turn-helix transcriptional regulator [Methylocapsa aurea]|uniref:MarR family winged helix-turn-helix transcriptional regulator n=1 Tax=Methylocapsa aurea TaxID=663610 RepID=UPI000567F455|nr:MarR family transcriptional regulator [Methylocapsa aurea]